ncbi:SPW repeat protein [Nafulsella turpanensis]|uniref:SPW repeat protein n=1 Tax=Nafulsella turpanensis TaxID=1265690 RepID=UPI0003465CB2|nr:SPW repeat protein [Nafulsella turpanensis]
MKFISTRTHGIIDYLMGALLIVSPWLFGFDRGGAETWIPVILGAGVILYSLVTDYEMSATRKLSLRTHLMLDMIGGAFLAVSPWLFGFDDFVYLPHLILGIAEIGVAMFTHRVPDTRYADTHKATTGTHTNRRTNNTITPESRPPMGSKTGTGTLTESERARRERENL